MVVSHCLSNMTKDRKLTFRVDEDLRARIDELASGNVGSFIREALLLKISADTGVCQLCKRPLSGEVGAAHIAQVHAKAQSQEEEPERPVYVPPEVVNAKVWLKRIMASAETAELKQAVTRWVNGMDPDDSAEERTPQGWQALAERWLSEQRNDSEQQVA